MPRLALIAALLAITVCTASAAEPPPAALRSVIVQAGGGPTFYTVGAVVEAVRQTVIAPQVAGVITQIAVKAADPIQRGQLLARIEPGVANQAAAASRAQVDAVHAELKLAARDAERLRQLFAQHFISQDALERAEAKLAVTQAQAKSLQAQSGVTNAQAGFYNVTAPYSGLVAEVPAMPGDMAMPGQPLMTVYDPLRLRVTATVPEDVAATMLQDQPVSMEISSLTAAQRWQVATQVRVLPMADSATHTRQLQLELPAGLAGLTPGMFARVLIPVQSAPGARLYVPQLAVIQRAELDAVYVLNEQGKPMLRQIKLGPLSGENIEVLSGLSAGERVALDPLAAGNLQ